MRRMSRRAARRLLIGGMALGLIPLTLLWVNILSDPQGRENAAEVVGVVATFALAVAGVGMLLAQLPERRRPESPYSLAVGITFAVVVVTNLIAEVASR